MYVNLLGAFWHEVSGYDFEGKIERGFDEDQVGITVDWSDYVVEDSEYGRGTIRYFDADGRLLAVRESDGDDDDFEFTDHGKMFLKRRLTIIFQEAINSLNGNSQ